MENGKEREGVEVRGGEERWKLGSRGDEQRGWRCCDPAAAAAGRRHDDI